MVGVGGRQACDVDEVGDHRRGGRLGARALAVVERRADGIAVDDDGVHGALDVGDQAARGNQGRVHAQLDAVGGAGDALAPLGDGKQLDPVAELLGVRDVGALQLADALDVGLVELHRHAEGDRAHDRRLVRGVDAGDVEGRIGLGIAQPLGVGERAREVDALLSHLRQDVIGRAVDDPGDPLDAVGGEPLAQRLDDRDATGDRRLEGDHHALLPRRGEDLGTVHGQQRLVGGDDVLAGGDRRQHQFARDARAADQLDHRVEVASRDQGTGVVDDLGTALGDRIRALAIKVGDVRDPDLASGPALDLVLVPAEHREGAAADDSGAEQADPKRLHLSRRRAPPAGRSHGGHGSARGRSRSGPSLRRGRRNSAGRRRGNDPGAAS